jgi:hypothetical protein
MTQHARLPSPKGSLTLKPGEPIIMSTYLVTAELRAWDGWKPAAKKFFDGAAAIDLASVVRGYTAIVRGFNEWFSRAWVTGHLEALDHLQVLINEHDVLVNRLASQAPTGAKE